MYSVFIGTHSQKSVHKDILGLNLNFCGNNPQFEISGKIAKPQIRGYLEKGGDSQVCVSILTLLLDRLTGPSGQAQIVKHSPYSGFK